MLLAYVSTPIYSSLKRLLNRGLSAKDEEIIAECLRRRFNECNYSETISSALDFTLIYPDKILIAFLALAFAGLTARLAHKNSKYLMTLSVAFFVISTTAQYLHVFFRDAAWRYITDRWTSRGMPAIHERCMEGKDGNDCSRYWEWLKTIESGASFISSLDNVIVVLLSIALAWLFVYCSGVGSSKK